MKRATKVTRLTISLPARLLEAAEERLVAPDESRSAFIRRLIEEALREAEEQSDVERYVRGYRERPQTEEEVGWSDQAAVEHLAEQPWK